MVVAASEGGASVRAFAWLIVAVVSLPAILLSTFVGGDPDWRYQVPSLVGLGLAVVVIRRWSALEPLRSFAIVWMAQLASGIVLFGLLDAVGYFDWFARTPRYQVAGVQSALFLVPAISALLTARALGYSNDDLYLRVGDRGAVGWVPVLNRHVSWNRLGLATIAVASAGGVVYVIAAESPSQAGFTLFVRWLPVGLAFAAINAIQEEIRFRSAVLATLVPGVGEESAIWMTAAIFGLAHWSQSTPSGPFGVVASGLIGAWLAKSMLETKGIGWPWIIHLVLDVVVFAALVFHAT